MANDRAIALSVRELVKRYEAGDDELTVLAGVNLEMKGGESLAITGPSGSGKSTLLHIIGGLDGATSGEVWVGGESIGLYSPQELARYRNRSVGFVFQDHHLLPQCTVLENVLLPTLAARGAQEADIARARQLVDRVGLGHRLEHRPAELSGGERQRVAIARALINQPTLLLCDEPTGNLDRVNAQSVSAMLVDLAREREAILVVVTHSRELAETMARELELRDGKLVAVSKGVATP